MVSREHLKREGRRAYEVGRLRAAARASWALVPVMLFCAFATNAGETCVCIGVALLGASVFLRWRDRRGADAVRDGLLAGALPLVAGVIVARVAPSCAGAPIASTCTVICLVVGLPSGLWLGRRLARGSASTSTWLAAGGVAVMAASLGCAGLGLAGLFGAASGLALGAVSASALARASS